MATLATFMSTTGVGITICRFMHTTAFFTVMNLSHIITEFSFGKHFPEITQPLDNSFEITHDGMLIPLGRIPCDNLQISLRTNTSFESSQPPTSHRAPTLYIPTSTV